MPSLYLFVYMYMISFMIVMSSTSWFMVWMGLEINMISFIMMVYSRYDQMCMESCIKYFFVQSLGSALFMGLFYMNMSYLSSYLMMILGYKMGGGPFFFWFPSVCEGFGWMSCFVLLSFQKVLPLLLLMMFASVVVWGIILMGLFIGSVGSFNQVNIKRLMGYSSIYHLGWIMICSMFLDMTWLVYLIIYGFMVFALMYVLEDEYVINFMNMLSWKGRWWFMLGMLSMSGMPPMLGFFLKLMVFNEIMDISLMWMFFLIFSSVIMFYVYFLVIYDVLMNFKIQLNLNNGVGEYMNKVDLVNVVGFVLGLSILVYIYM